jgi:serine/threonine protein kinase
LEEAGRGAMGQVFKARDRETREIVALKILKPEIASDAATIERFKSELLFARKITHKNVCRVYEFNRVDGVAYTSMEFVEGESLRSVLKRFGSLTRRKGIDIALQLCSGLKEAHAQGIVHRDLKPENVMIDTRGNVKVMDFGIARSMETLTLTTGGLIGTPAYMAPEQAAGKPVDHRADIYALGLMLYEMFTGTQAFRGDNAVAVALKHINEAPRPPRELEPSISPASEKAILRCLEKDPNNRFQSIAELETELSLERSNASSAEPQAVAPAAEAMTDRSAAVREAASAPVGSGKSRGNSAIAIGSFLLVVAIALGARIVRHHEVAKLNADIDQESLEIHSPTGTLSITPDSVSIRENDPAKTPGASPTTKSVTIKNGKVLVTDGAKSQMGKPALASPPSLSSSNSVNSAPSVAPTPNSATSNSSTPTADANATAQPSSTEDIPEGALPRRGGRYVWVNRFARQVGAENSARKIENLGLPVSVVPRRNVMSNAEFFVVLCGPFEQSKIDEMVEKLKSDGFVNARPNYAGPRSGAGSKEGPRATP